MVNHSRVWFTVILFGFVGIILIANRWKSSQFHPKETNSAAKSEKQILVGDELPQREITRIEFLNTIFEKSKPSPFVSRILTSKPGSYSKDSLELALRWAEETENTALVALLQTDLAEQFGIRNETEIARSLVFAGASVMETPVISAYLFQLGKKYIDIGLKKQPSNTQIMNALIVYQSEYLQAPMQFLGTLRQALASDSSNIETHFIHLNLLKKSQQWPKALKKCEKLISLQPENSRWLFEMSDIFGIVGDSVNAKVYLNLAVKTQNKSQ